MISFKKFLSDDVLAEAIAHQGKEHIPLTECVFRYGSQKYFEFFSQLRSLHESGVLEDLFPNLSEEELELLESNLGEFAEFEGESVPLDFIIEDETPELNSPKRGGRAKYIVYVRDPQTGNIKKIQFGDTTGLTAKYNNPERKRAFAARHKCSDAKDKMSKKYWACRINKYLGKTPQARSGYW